MQKSKIIRILFVTLFMFASFLSLYGEDPQLQTIKDRSIQELSIYFRNGKNATEYTKEQISKIDDIKDDADRRIDDSNDKETVLAVLDEAKKKIDKVETKQELQKTKENLKADVEKYLKAGSESDYTTEKLEEIALIKQEYGKEIEQSTDTSAANTKLEEAKQKIGGVPTSLELLSSLEAAYITLVKKVVQLELELVNKQDKEHFIRKELFSLLAIFLVLLVITFIVIIYFEFKKYKISNLNKVRKLIEDYINDLHVNDLQKSFENSYKEINGKIQLLTEECKELKAKSKVDTTIKKPVETLRPIDLPKPVEIIPDDPIEDFNNWAADPSKPLPNRFYYVKGEIKLRAEQSFAESYSPTEWIGNKRTDKRYLLPNPNFFEELTNIKSFYKMDIGQLKPRGQNKIKVIEPCKMSDKGWIDNPGELEFR